MLRATGQTVILRLERYLRGPKYEQLQLAIANSELKPPTPGSPSASAISLPRFPISTVGIPKGNNYTHTLIPAEIGKILILVLIF